MFKINNKGTFSCDVRCWMWDVRTLVVLKSNAKILPYTSHLSPRKELSPFR